MNTSIDPRRSSPRNLGLNETVSRAERYSSVDRCAMLWLRFDGKRSLVEFQPLLHADQTQPSTSLCDFAVKANTAVTHREMNFIRGSPQTYFDVP